MKISNNNAKIIVIKKENPKRGNSKTRYDIYLNNESLTIEQFITKGGRKADITWDIEHGYIRVQDGDKLYTRTGEAKVFTGFDDVVIK
jgi:hypothetical protein